MTDMRSDSAETVELMTSAVGSVHFITRLFSASAERVRNMLLDPALQAMWANSGSLATTVPPIQMKHGYMHLREQVEGHPVRVRIRIHKCPRVCEVNLELRMGPEFALSTLFALGIDDLWEARLYAIADLLHSGPFSIRHQQ
ncbi:MAG: hypothetical protein IPN44_14280 [Flavobacteriales bacterium]|nr:hypothetical protein [Flavobacteriales bacterium]